MQWTNRTMVVSAAGAPMARTLTEAFAPVGGSNMFAVGLSASGATPETHYISAGLIDEEFAALLPLTTVTTDEAGVETVSTTPGQPEVVVALAAELGMTVTLQEVQWLFSQCDITDSEPLQRLDRLGLKMIQPPELA